MMKKFTIDSKNEIGRKRVKVSSTIMNNLYESKLREIIKEILRYKKW